jgi:hypothetical protein
LGNYVGWISLTLHVEEAMASLPSLIKYLLAILLCAGI